MSEWASWRRVPSELGGDSLTIGVAVTVPDPWGERLQEQRAGYGDPLAWTVPTHITLLPPTQVPEKRIGEVDEHLAAVAKISQVFDVALCGAGSFRPVTQTSFLALCAGARECEQLAEVVRSGPLRRRLPFPYHPHVTMAVDLSDEVHDQVERELAEYELQFGVDHLWRYQLTDYGVWEPVAGYPLAGRMEPR